MISFQKKVILVTWDNELADCDWLVDGVSEILILLKLEYLRRSLNFSTLDSDLLD